jgi:predicted glycosyltransferase
MKRRDHVRILMYSHDTFGLGHLRRCRTIAHHLAERFGGMHIMIISGSPIAGAFDFKTRVDFIKIPSVIKLRNGEYTSIAQHMDLDDTMAMRSAMIRDTAKAFDPDIFIVDKEPVGLRGELEEALTYLKGHGCSLVLGLRDVLDSPELLAAEWKRKDIMSRVEAFYHQIWVYGPEGFWDPLMGLEVSASVRARMTYCGFLQRSLPQSYIQPADGDQDDYILVTTGGGGDGLELLRQVLAAYECEPNLPSDALLVMGPFMPGEAREEVAMRAAALDRVRVIEFDNRIEKLIVESQGVVGMCGYNTFCELLSFDKRALMIPRVSPRKEQYVRAFRAAELGLIDMLHPDEADDPRVMVEALKRLPTRPRPSDVGVAHMMNGLDVIGDRTFDLISHRHRRMLSVIEGRM